MAPQEDDSLDHGQDRSDRQGGDDVLDYCTFTTADGEIIYSGQGIEDETLGIATGEKFRKE